ncbi:MAG: recombinase [Nitrososphaerales archaeon]
MSVKALQNYTLISKYARWLPDKKRRETWNETVDRVKNMMLEKYSDIPEVFDHIDFAYEMMRKKRVLGSQRALQFGGQDVFHHNAKIYNCTSSYVDRLRFFQECMYLLLCGSGTGFSVQKHHIDKLPPLIDKKSGKKKFTIPDDIQGWSDACGLLISSYFDQNELFPEYSGKKVEYDYHLIRPEGAKIGHSGGKAPGPEPLKRSLELMELILDNALARKDKKLRPIDAFDLVMHEADAVLSGGVRRSATICLFSPDDLEMAKAKTGSWFRDNPQRGRANISALLLKNLANVKDQFKDLMKCVKEFGEPGFVWADSTELIVNPCVEIGMYPVDITTNLNGWQGCNLSTINCAKVHSNEEFLECAKAASIIGTLQAGFTSFPYLGEVSERIFRREALLGVSGTGWLENPEICLKEDLQREGAKLVIEINKKISKIIGINQAARTTCVKPEGTASCILGTSSGIHPHHYSRYIRRVQANKNENVYKFFKNINSRACEDSIWSSNKTDGVIAFCVEVPPGAKTKNQVSAIELLEIVKSTQKNWVESGKVKNLCTQDWLSHNVSNTINIKENEWEEVEQFIYENRKWFAGISLLPITGDKDYAQAPFSAVYLPSQMIRYHGDGVMFVSGLIELCLNLYDDNLWKACDSLLGIGEEVSGKAKKSLLNRCQKFAQKYFNGELRRLTYAMKDIYNYKLWTELKQEMKEVDYTQLIEEENNTKLQQEWACQGNQCVI